MSKFLILKDEDCGVCRDCQFNHDYGFCFAALRELEVDVDYELEFDGKSNPDWCPLREMPPEAVPDNSDMPIMWNVGWNACLDELEGKR